MRATLSCYAHFGQVIRTLRLSFCNQSDGLARVEAITSLLLSESRLQTSAGVAMAVTTEAATAAATATMTTTTEVDTPNFLETREAFCLDAAVSAGIPDDNGEAEPGAFAAGEFSSGDVNSVVKSSRSSRNCDQRVDVGTVLREMSKKERNRRRLLLGRLQQQQQHQQQQHRYRHRQQIDGAVGILNNDYTEQIARDNDEGGREGPEDENGRWLSQQGRGNIEVSSQKIHEEGDISVKRLALAASVSTLSGMLDPLDGVNPDFSCSDGSGGGKERPFSGRMGGGAGAVVRAAHHLGLPLLMIQSTEDALIGSPLALLVKQEVWFVGYRLTGWGVLLYWVDTIPFISVFASSSYDV